MHDKYHDATQSHAALNDEVIELHAQKEAAKEAATPLLAKGLQDIGWIFKLGSKSEPPVYRLLFLPRLE